VYAQVCSINALSSGAGLFFGSPAKLADLADVRSSLESQKRLKRPTIHKLVAMGVTGFCWLSPREQLTPEHDGSRWPGGAFAYVYDDPAKDQLFPVAPGLRTGLPCLADEVQRQVGLAESMLLFCRGVETLPVLPKCFAWFDPNPNGPENGLIRKKLDDEGYDVRTFSDAALLAEFFFENQSESWLLVTDGFKGKPVVEAVRELPNVYTIIVICNEPEEEAYARRELQPLDPKVKHVIDDTADFATIGESISKFWASQPLNPLRVSSVAEVKHFMRNVLKDGVSFARWIQFFAVVCGGGYNVAFISYNVFVLPTLPTPDLGSQVVIDELDRLAYIANILEFVVMVAIALLVLVSCAALLAHHSTIRASEFETFNLPDAARYSAHFFVSQLGVLARFSLFKGVTLCNPGVISRLYRREVHSLVERLVASDSISAKIGRQLLGAACQLALVLAAFVAGSVAVIIKVSGLFKIFLTWEAQWTNTTRLNFVATFLGFMNQLQGLADPRNAIMHGLLALVFSRPNGSYSYHARVREMQLQALVAFEAVKRFGESSGQTCCCGGLASAAAWLTTMTELDLQHIITTKVKRTKGATYDFNAREIEVSDRHELSNASSLSLGLADHGHARREIPPPAAGGGAAAQTAEHAVERASMSGQL